MTRKFSFLFWLGNNISQFAVANSLQEKIECKFNGIISSNDKFKDFYQKQKFVEFENLWVCQDYIENFDANPDMDYLSDFEKKYQISLWEIIFSERIFYYEYNKYHKFTRNELLLILEQTCRFFESIFEKISPDVVFTQLPIGHNDYLFYKMCIALNIRTLYYKRSRIGYKATIIDSQEYVHNENIEGKNKFNSFSDIETYLEKFSSFKQIRKKANISVPYSSRIISFLKFYFSSAYDDEKHYSSIGKNGWSLTKNDSRFIRKFRLKSREKYLNKICIDYIDPDIPFVYFPLHFEPERNLLIDNRFYSNQIFIIESISKSLPVNFQLYVKDHPRMKQRTWREPSYYDKIISLPNVKLLSPSVDPKIILKNCSLVISISGTVGFEAAFNNKPSITFGTENFDFPSSIIQIDNPKDLPNAIKQALQTTTDLSEVSLFIEKIISNSFDFDIFEIDNNFNDKFPYLGYLNNTSFSPSEIQKFLLDNKIILEKLTMANLHKLKDLIKS